MMFSCLIQWESCLDSKAAPAKMLRFVLPFRGSDPVECCPMRAASNLIMML